MKPFYLGKKKFSSNVFYAPLAGCSDYPFRRMAMEYQRPGLFFCEMVKMDALIRSDPGTFRLLDYTENMHPIGAQLCGSRPDYAGEAAAIIEDLGFDVLDLNCGCPVDKVTKDGSGSGLLKNPDLAGEIISAMVSRVSIPVTMKIRAGWDEENIVARKMTEIAEQAGAKAVFVHGRTREQAYKGRSNRNYIRECKEAARSIKVFGNGDVFTPEDALSLLEETGCDGVLVARGTMGQPWIAEEIYRLSKGNRREERSFEERKEALRKHFFHITRYSSPGKALLDMRRVGCWYFKNADHTREIRGALAHAKNLREVEGLIEGLFCKTKEFSL